jgi:hypothetical protein
MAFLRYRYMAVLTALLCLACGGGTLSTLPSELVDVQREANLTRNALSGVWKGNLTSIAVEQAEETIYLVFTQPDPISLSGSYLVRESIDLSGSVQRDTFALANGVFEKPNLRFNLLSGGALVVYEGAPVLYLGLLSENSFISGTVVSDDLTVGEWEARLRNTATTP